MKRKSTLLVCVVAGAILARPALAILGLGDIVYDPTNFEENVQQLLQMEQQYTQLVQTYQTVRAQYDELLLMAKNIPGSVAARYRALATPWSSSSAANTYGTSLGWSSAINTGTGVGSGYATATQPLQAYGGTLGNLPADQVDHIKTDYATVELTDGANLATIETIGRVRGNAPAVETAIENLENDSLSSDPDLNTEVAVLNKINAAGVIGLRNGQDTNKLLVALAEAQTIQAKRERDAEARAFNEHIRFTAEGQAILASQGADSSSAMLAWRMP
jgi:hypothetical protein